MNKSWNQIVKEYGRCLRTYTGKKVDIFDPDPESICIEDIAHALSNICRFAGHVPEFYSVAEHSYLASLLAKPEHELAALMHDAAEAYMVDLPRPVKMEMPEFSIIEDKLMKVIAKKFGFQYPLPEDIVTIDNRLVKEEFYYLMLDYPIWGLPPAPIQLYEPLKAEEAFLETYQNIVDAAEIVF